MKTYSHGRSTYSGARWHVRQFRPNFVLFSKASKPWFSEFITWLRQQRITSVCWQWDLFWGYGRDPIPAFNCDYVFSTDGGHSNKWPGHHQVLRQGIHLPEHQFYEPGDWKASVAFVGRAMPYRRRLLKHLDENWQCLRVTSTRCLPLNRLLSKIKIVVGDSVNVKHYWSNRIYEITGRGGFILHPETEGLNDHFNPGVHYDTFIRDDMGDLDAKIRFYLDNESERERIRRAGFEHCGSVHTYSHRVRELLQAVGQS